MIRSPETGGVKRVLRGESLSKRVCRKAARDTELREAERETKSGERERGGAEEGGRESGGGGGNRGNEGGEGRGRKAATLP